MAGADTGFFTNCTTHCDVLPARRLGRQYPADVRDLSGEILSGRDVVVPLATLSNNPMGKKFEEVTSVNNQRANVVLAGRWKGVVR